MRRSATGSATWPRSGRRPSRLLEATTPPLDDCILPDAINYLDNRSKLVTIYYLEKKYVKARAIGEALLKQIDKFSSLDAEHKANETLRAKNLVLSSIRGEAYLEFDKGDHAKVTTLLDPLVGEIDKSLTQRPPRKN